MCKSCDDRTIGRRGFLTMVGLGFVASSLVFETDALGAASGPHTSKTPDEALAALKEGNARYVSSPEVCAANLGKRRADVAHSQAPWATIVGCSDSRVPHELLFGGLGLGEVFVARNAGNMVDTATMGTIEYGAAVLGSPLIINVIVRGNLSRIAFSVSMPPMPGMTMSRQTRSGRSFSIASRAISPVLASPTRCNGVSRRMARSSWRLRLSSSTMYTFLPFRFLIRVLCLTDKY